MIGHHGLVVTGALLLTAGLLTAVSSGGTFSALYRYRRAATRWMQLPRVPMSRSMWVAVAVLGLAEAAIVAGIVLLALGASG